MVYYVSGVTVCACIDMLAVSTYRERMLLVLHCCIATH